VNSPMTHDKSYKHVRALDTYLYMWDVLDTGDKYAVYASIVNFRYNVTLETARYYIDKKDIGNWHEFNSIQS
jgi:hypothetical protein